MKKVLMISADAFEDTELLVPYYRLKEEGIEVVVASTKSKAIKGKKGYDIPVDKAVKDVDPKEFDMLVVPGGKAPAALRNDDEVLDIVRSFFENDKPVAAICHGPQVLISAGVMKGRHATSYRTVAKELKDAGAKYENKEVVVDGNLVTSRQPSDLPVFMRELMKKIRGR